MSNDNDVLVSGLFFNLPREGAPDFVKGRLGINVEELGTFLREQYKTIEPNDKGQRWLNIDLLVSKAGKPYAKVNDFKPEATPEPVPVPVAVAEEEDLPF